MVLHIHRINIQSKIFIKKLKITNDSPLWNPKAYCQQHMFHWPGWNKMIIAMSRKNKTSNFFDHFSTQAHLLYDFAYASSISIPLGWAVYVMKSCSLHWKCPASIFLLRKKNISFFCAWKEVLSGQPWRLLFILWATVAQISAKFLLISAWSSITLQGATVGVHRVMDSLLSYGYAYEGYFSPSDATRDHAQC